MKFTNKELTVYYKGKPITMISPAFIAKQKIDRETLEELKLTHEDRARIFEAMEATDNVEDLKEFAAQFEVIEFEQQKLWGFKLNRDFHRWWKVPKCLCPNMDNEDAYGTKYRHIKPGCPIHGNA